MIAESLERRVLAAVLFVDGVTGAVVETPLVIEGMGLRWLRNRSAVWVLTEAPGLESHVSAFAAPPGAPPPGSIKQMLTVRDPTGRYLPRRTELAIPRNADPAVADQPDSLFQPVVVPLYPSATAALAPGWAVLRLTVTGATPGSRLRGALLRVQRASDDAVLARGISDDRGEALVPVPGIPVTTWSDAPEAVVVSEIDAVLQVIPNPGPGTVPDPETLDGLAPSKTVNLKLASGRVQVLTV
jgi:hypothetical protein